MAPSLPPEPAGDPAPAPVPEAFAREAAKPRPGLVAEFWLFLRQNKKWWILPILVLLLLFGALLVLGSTGAAPFIYTIF